MATSFDINSLANKLVEVSPPWLQDELVIFFYAIVLIGFIGGIYFLLDKIIIQHFPRIRLDSKIIEAYSARGDAGFMYLFRLSIINTGKKPFYPKIWRAKLKHRGDQRFHDVTPIMARYFQIPIRDVKGSEVDKKLKTENIRYIQTVLALKPAQLVDGYIILLDDETLDDRNIDQIIIELQDYKNKDKTIQFEYNEIVSTDLFHDDSIWEDAN